MREESGRYDDMAKRTSVGREVKLVGEEEEVGVAEGSVYEGAEGVDRSRGNLERVPSV